MSRGLPRGSRRFTSGVSVSIRDDSWRSRGRSAPQEIVKSKPRPACLPGLARPGLFPGLCNEARERWHGSVLSVIVRDSNNLPLSFFIAFHHRHISSRPRQNIGAGAKKRVRREKEEESCLFGRDSGQRARSSKVGLALNFVDSVWPRSVILILEAWSKIGRKMLMPAFWPCDFFFFLFFFENISSWWVRKDRNHRSKKLR